MQGDHGNRVAAQLQFPPHILLLLFLRHHHLVPEILVPQFVRDGSLQFFDGQEAQGGLRNQQHGASLKTDERFAAVEDFDVQHVASLVVLEQRPQRQQLRLCLFCRREDFLVRQLLERCGFYFGCNFGQACTLEISVEILRF
jgi:hypothetical protein